MSRGRVATHTSFSVALRPLAFALPTDPAETVAPETDVVAFLQDKDPFFCAIMSDHPVSREDIQDL